MKSKLKVMFKQTKPKFEIAKKRLFNSLKFIGIIGLKIVSISSMIAFSVIPFLHNIINHTLAQWLWYPSFAIFLMLVIVDYIKNKEPTFKTPVFEFWGKWGFANVFPMFISIFVFNYYDIDFIWLWIIFAYVAIYVPLFFISLLTFDIKNNSRTKEEQQKASLNICKYIMLYWLLDLLYISIANNWLMATIVFGVLSVIIIFFNLGNAFLNGTKSLRFLIVLDLVIGLCLSAYLIFIIPNDSLQNITLTITASVFGGIFTLIGVAWTFKKGDADRQADLHRLETERKEEERKKFVPYINISKGNQSAVTVNAHIHTGLDFEKAEDINKCTNNSFYLIQIENFDIKNISESNIIIDGIRIDDIYYKFESTMLERNSVCCIQTTSNWSIALPQYIQSIKLVICDILQNTYEVECKFKFTADSDMNYVIVEAKAGEKFTGFNGTYVITNISLPMLLQEDTP